jgi:hypothetical protein
MFEPHDCTSCRSQARCHLNLDSAAICPSSLRRSHASKTSVPTLAGHWSDSHSAFVKRWSSTAETEPASLPSGIARAGELLTALKLSASTLPGRVLHELRSSAGRQIEQLSEAVFKSISTAGEVNSLKELLAQNMCSTQPGSGGALLQDIRDGVLGNLNRDQQTSESQIHNLLQTLSSDVGEQAATLTTLREGLQATLTCCQQLSGEIDTAFQGLSLEEAGPEQLQELCRHYCVLTGSRTIYEVFQQYIQAMQESLNRNVSDAGSLHQKIDSISQHMAATFTVHTGIPQPVVDAFVSRIADD